MLHTCRHPSWHAACGIRDLINHNSCSEAAGSTPCLHRLVNHTAGTHLSRCPTMTLPTVPYCTVPCCAAPQTILYHTIPYCIKYTRHPPELRAHRQAVRSSRVAHVQLHALLLTQVLERALQQRLGRNLWQPGARATVPVGIVCYTVTKKCEQTWSSRAAQRPPARPCACVYPWHSTIICISCARVSQGSATCLDFMGAGHGLS